MPGIDVQVIGFQARLMATLRHFFAHSGNYEKSLSCERFAEFGGWPIKSNFASKK
jgi:hypothetical protein